MNALGQAVLEAARARFSDAALVDARGPTPGAAALDAALADGLLAPLEWMARTAEHRRDLRARWPWARTLVLVVENYYSGDHPSGTAPKVSRYAWGRDYHRTMRRRLRKLRSQLKQLEPEATISVFNDNDPVLERAWLASSGLGFIGKSGMFIHKRLGTWTFLGGLALDLDCGASPPQPATNHCGTCTRCMDACPPAAIVAPGRVDARRCITTWNIEHPEDAPEDVLSGHGWAAGCDVCQEVCPWNRFQTLTELADYAPRHPRLDEAALDAADLTGTPLARPGAPGLRIAIGRARGDEPKEQPS